MNEIPHFGEMSKTGEISMNTDEFYTLVRSMREAQRLYFKTRGRDVLIESKRLEAEADKEIQRYFEQQTAEAWDKHNVDDNAKAERRKAFVGALHSALKAFVEHIDALEELKSCITIMEEFMEAYQYERD